jgi:hypothetical protein
VGWACAEAPAFDDLVRAASTWPRELRQEPPTSRAGCGYSALNVTEGSTLTARQAGTQQAIPETATSSAMTPR